VVGAAAVATVVIAALLRARGDGTLFGTLLVYGPRHWLVWGWAGLAFVTLLLRAWGAAAVAAVMTLMASVAVAGGALGRPREAAPGARTVRVVTWSIDGSTTLGARLDVALTGWNADLVLVQACSDSAERQLRAVVGHEVDRTGEFCLLSRHPIRAAVHLASLPLLDRGPRGPPTGSVPAAAYAVDIAGRWVTVVQLHLPSPRRGLSAVLQGGGLQRLEVERRDRERASRAIRARLGDPTGALIVAGDFNAPPGSRLLRTDWGHLTDAFPDVGLGFGHTMAAGPFRLRIDYVLVDPSLSVLRAEVQRGFPTEHQPLVVGLLMP
jgi:endonuclease/exonuclease/phosphatase (EEP) superfamily protein YafD